MLHDPRLLLEDFNGYRAKTYNAKKVSKKSGGHFAMRPLRPTQDRIDALTAMQAWCEGHGIDARQWLYYLFNNVRKWMYAPDIKRPTHLINEKRVADFKQSAVPYDYTAKMQAEAQVRDVVYQRTHNPQVDLLPAAENTKGRYRTLRREEVCLSLLRETYGYHPKSKHCPSCPQAGPCEAATRRLWPVDVVELRLK